MLTQLDYGDFAGSDARVSRWNDQLDKYKKINNYFFGNVFDDARAKGTSDESAEPVELYPLRVNLVKMMTMTHAQMMMGQWEDQVIDFKVKDKKRRGPRLDQWGEEAVELIRNIYEENYLNHLMMDGILSMMLYGGCVFKTTSDYNLYHRVRIDHILPEYFFPRWHPFNPNKMLEAFVEFRMPIEDAILAYKFKPSGVPAAGDTVLYREHWTETQYSCKIVQGESVGGGQGGNEMVIAGGQNPYGSVPFTYIPRIRPPGEFYGMSVAEDIMGIQDEVNMRLADVGDRINYSAHPVWIIKNYYGDDEKFVIAPDEVINLGAALGGLEPNLEVVPPPGEPQSTFSYLEMCLDLAKRGAMSPPIAFGEDQGSQRSALTLEFRMWPLIQQAKWARSNWTTAMEQMNDKIMRIRVIKDDMEKRPESDRIKPSLLSCRVLPEWQPMMPRDRLDTVTEVMEAWSRGDEPLISAEAAIEILKFTKDSEEEFTRLTNLWKERREHELELEEAKAEIAQQRMEQSQNNA